MRIDFWTIAFIVILFGGGGYWMYSNIQEKKVAARIAHQKQLNEEKRVQEEEEARKSTQKLLQDLVAREEKNLQKIIEEHKIELQDINEDAKQLSEALAAVEQKAKDGDEKARKRKQARYSPAERVLLILEDKDINDLALKYLGEDLSAERAKFRDKVNFELRSHVEYQRKLKAIADKYYKTVSGLDARVDKLNREAAQLSRSAHASIKRTLDELTADKKRKEKEWDNLKKGPQGSRTIKQIVLVEVQLEQIRKEMNTAQERMALAQSQGKRDQAAEAETFVRKKKDTAQEVRSDEKDMADAERIHQTAVFGIASSFEERSLGFIRIVMKNRIDMINKEINDTRAKLDFMRSTAVNMDFLNSKELENVRQKIAKKLTEGVDINMSNK